MSDAEQRLQDSPSESSDETKESVAPELEKQISINLGEEADVTGLIEIATTEQRQLKCFCPQGFKVNDGRKLRLASGLYWTLLFWHQHGVDRLISLERSILNCCDEPSPKMATLQMHLEGKHVCFTVKIEVQLLKDVEMFLLKQGHSTVSTESRFLFERELLKALSDTFADKFVWQDITDICVADGPVCFFCGEKDDCNIHIADELSHVEVTEASTKVFTEKQSKVSRSVALGTSVSFCYPLAMFVCSENRCIKLCEATFARAASFGQSVQTTRECLKCSSPLCFVKLVEEEHTTKCRKCNSKFCSSSCRTQHSLCCICSDRPDDLWVKCHHL